MIIRRKHTSRFTVIPNSTADDEALCADALGLLVYLLAKPNDWLVNVANLRKRFGLGRNRVYAILKELAEAGYVKRTQSRNVDARFVDVEYTVYDCPEAQAAEAVEAENEATTPLPQIRETDTSTVEKPNKTPASLKTDKRKSGKILKTDLTKSIGLAPSEGAGEEKQVQKVEESSPSKPLSLNAQVWRLAKTILAPKEYAVVGRWLKRLKDKPNGLQSLLEILEGAARAGTPQPVPYVTAALNKRFPPPPDPSIISKDRWALLVQAAINLKTWDSEFGPRPGEKGCQVPPDLVTPELIRAVSVRRVA